MPKRLDFFFFLGSTYTYLSVCRAAELAEKYGVELVWRPFSVRTLMKEQNNIPFATKPRKFAYMWRDIERRTARFGIPFAGPQKHPVDAEERANHVATVAAMQGWCPEFTRAAYDAWMIGGADPGNWETLTSICKNLGRDFAEIEKLAASSEVLERYAAETNRARDLGIFGSPTYVCDSEIFWGDDRLEDAIEWCKTNGKAKVENGV